MFLQNFGLEQLCSSEATLHLSLYHRVHRVYSDCRLVLVHQIPCLGDKPKPSAVAHPRCSPRGTWSFPTTSSGHCFKPCTWWGLSVQTPRLLRKGNNHPEPLHVWMWGPQQQPPGHTHPILSSQVACYCRNCFVHAQLRVLPLYNGTGLKRLLWARLKVCLCP